MFQKITCQWPYFSNLLLARGRDYALGRIRSGLKEVRGEPRTSKAESSNHYSWQKHFPVLG